MFINRGVYIHASKRAPSNSLGNSSLADFPHRHATNPSLTGKYRTAAQ
jgi:hypothetical protein